MARIYAAQVIAGEMLWTEIPSLWRKKACAEIEKQGYILNEDGTVSLPEPEPTPEPTPDDSEEVTAE